MVDEAQEDDSVRSRTIFCGNLSEKVTDELLYELFLQVRAPSFAVDSVFVCLTKLHFDSLFAGRTHRSHLNAER